jgi:hypothetical protein
MKKTFNSEKDVKEAVKQILKMVPMCWWFMPPANGLGRSGIPDFIGQVNGRFFAVETKFGKGKTTANQDREISQIRDTGAPVWIVNEANLREFTAEFASWVKTCL